MSGFSLSDWECWFSSEGLNSLCNSGPQTHPPPLCCSLNLVCSHFPACVDANHCVSLILINSSEKKKKCIFAVLRRGKCRSSSGKLVKACRKLSSSESTRAFPVCSLQLAASACSSPPSLPPSPSQSHLSSVTLPPPNLSDAVGRDLALPPLW